MKKVLIISYYWPPSGGSGVQRWLKFVKYLPEFGWQPIVYTPENPEMPVVDESLANDIPKEAIIIKQSVWEPYQVYRLFTGRKKTDKINASFLSENKRESLTQKMSVWVRGNFFIPDARKFWINPSIKYLTKYLQENKVDLIISSGPPHSLHLIALGLKQKFNIPWMADFRDPWTNIDFYKELRLSSFADKKHKRQELSVLQHADKVISIGPSMSDEMYELLGKDKHKFDYITNGYDSSDVIKTEVIMDKKFSIAHIGTLVKSRNPEKLWSALANLVKEDKEFANDLEIKLVGKVDIVVLDDLEKYGLKKYLNKIEYLSHKEVIIEQQKTQVLLLIINNTPNAKSILTGKFFEYLAAERPILAIGPPDGDVSKILTETEAGVMIPFDDEKGFEAQISAFYKNFKAKDEGTKVSVGFQKYSRRALTERLVGMMNEMI